MQKGNTIYFCFGKVIFNKNIIYVNVVDLLLSFKSELRGPGVLQYCILISNMVNVKR